MRNYRNIPLFVVLFLLGTTLLVSGCAPQDKPTPQEAAQEKNAR